MKKILFLAALSLVGILSNDSNASLIYGTVGGTANQDFNGLANTGTPTWADNVTLAGWYSNRTAYVPGTGTGTAGALYSFGSTTSSGAPSTERALGGVASGSVAARWGIQFQNTTGVTLNSMTIRYDGEQWRDGGNTTLAFQSLTFDYLTGAALHSIGAGAGTLVPALNFTSPIATATAGALDGNAAANSTPGIFSVTGLTWNNGDFLMLRWTDANDTGFDHGLAIDNFSFSAVPEPTTVAMFGLSLFGMGVGRRRRAI